MKKIWSWLLLLLLLIIFCVWFKKDSIHLTKHSDTQSIATVPVVEKVHYIEYAIIQDNDKHYSLEGKFATTQQQERFKEILSKSKKTLSMNHTSTNETLHGEPAIALTSVILPHFCEHYSEGKIVYHNQKLTVTGTVDSYKAQHEMQRLLNTSTLASADESSIIKNLPIEYAIHKNAHQVYAEGVFNDLTQIKQIKMHLPSNATSSFQIKAHHIDTGSLRTVEGFLPTFFSAYTQGDIIYHKEILVITGNVHSQVELDTVNRLLSNTVIPVKNRTIIDPNILAQMAKEKARLATLEKEEKAKQATLEEERALEAVQISKKNTLSEDAASIAKEKIVQQQAAQNALLDAQRKAKLEAVRKAQLIAEQERAKAIREEKKKRAEAAKEAEIRIKILNLFKLENIEFNVNKSTLTKKGQNTVNKLANILKEYPSVHVEIAGHTDSDGSVEYNQKLSQSRVNMIKAKLIAQGINSTRLVAKGYGETKPLVPNNSRANKAKNRRVEINILGE